MKSETLTGLYVKHHEIYDIHRIDFLTVGIRVWQMSQLQFMIEKRRPDILTVCTKFYDFSVSRDLFSNAEMHQFGANGNQRILECREPTG